MCNKSLILASAYLSPITIAPFHCCEECHVFVATIYRQRIVSALGSKEHDADLVLFGLEDLGFNQQLHSLEGLCQPGLVMLHSTQQEAKDACY